MALVVGYDRHPAGRAALVFAGELAGALNVPLHVVHVVNDSDETTNAATNPASVGDGDVAERVEDAFDSAHLQWTYHRLAGDAVTALLDAADENSASMLILGRPEQGLSATVGHIITGNVARKVLRRSTRPVVVVPEFGAAPR